MTHYSEKVDTTIGVKKNIEREKYQEIMLVEIHFEDPKQMLILMIR